jgi:hypothetical protein
MHLKKAKLPNLTNSFKIKRALEVTHGKKKRRIMPVLDRRGDDSLFVGLRHGPPGVLARGVVDGEQKLDGVDGLSHIVSRISFCKPTEDRNIATIENQRQNSAQHEDNEHEFQTG